MNKNRINLKNDLHLNRNKYKLNEKEQKKILNRNERKNIKVKKNSKEMLKK